MILKANDVELNKSYFALDRDTETISDCVCTEKHGATAILSGEQIGKFMTCDFKPYKKGEDKVPYDESNCFKRTAHLTREDAQHTLDAYKLKTRHIDTNDAALRMADAMAQSKSDNQFGE